MIVVGGCEWGVKGAAVDDVPVNIVTCRVATVTAADLQPCNEQGVLPESSCHCHPGAETLHRALLRASRGLEGGEITVGVVWGSACGDESHLWDRPSWQPSAVSLHGAGLIHITFGN